MDTKISFAELRKSYSNVNLIHYKTLLNTAEWDEKRKAILERDRHKCTNCNRRQTRELDLSYLRAFIKPIAKVIDWKIVGLDYTLPGPVTEGNYWLFSKTGLDENRSAYWEFKYQVVKNSGRDFVLIKAPKRYHL